MLAALVAMGAAPTTPQPQPRLGEVIRVRTAEGALRFEWIGERPPPDKAFPVAGPEAAWTVRAPAPSPGVLVGSLELERPVAGTRDPRSYWWASVSVSPQRTRITAHRGGRTAFQTTLRFNQTPAGAVDLQVINNVTRAVTRAQASGIVELRHQHPQLVREFLVPLLRQISGTDPLFPGPTEVYQVFSDLSANEEVRLAVQALLAGLADPDYVRRQHASDALARLGPQAVCAVLRMDRDRLLPEQRIRLETLLAINSHRVIEDHDTARRDPSFLADCMEFPDERVRRIARNSLEDILGRPIPMHHAPTPDEWSAAADIIRTRLAEASQTPPTPTPTAPSGIQE